MKNRITVFILTFSAALCFSSCGGTDINRTATEEVPAAETTAAETEITEAVTVAVTEKEKVSLTYDFTGLDSENAIKILSSEKYHIRFRYDYSGQQLYEDVYVDGGNTLVKTNFMNIDYSMLYKDQKQYTMINDIYYVLESDGEVSSDEMASADYFSGFGYTRSGETDLDGSTYKFDEYYQETTDSYTKFILTDDNNLYAIESSDDLIYVEACDSDFNSEEIICVPEEMNEVSEEDFNKAFLEAVTSDTESVSEEESDDESELSE